MTNAKGLRKAVPLSMNRKCPLCRTIFVCDDYDTFIENLSGWLGMLRYHAHTVHGIPLGAYDRLISEVFQA